MNIRHAALIVAASTILASEAWAQANSDQATLEFGAQIIARAEAQDLFATEPNHRAAAVRHLRSGMRCVFAVDGSGEITVFPANGELLRGDDVGCGENTAMGAINIFATRQLQALDATIELGSAVQTLRVVHPEAQELPLSALTRLELGNEAEVPPSPTAAFVIQDRGVAVFTRVSTFVAHGWTYTLRFTSPNPRNNIMADMVWKTMLVDLVAHIPSSAEASNE